MLLTPPFPPPFTARQSNEVIYNCRWEETTGPSGEYVEVIDYDPTKECFYAPINLENNYVLADYGLDPSEGDPDFTGTGVCGGHDGDRAI